MSCVCELLLFEKYALLAVFSHTVAFFITITLSSKSMMVFCTFECQRIPLDKRFLLQCNLGNVFIFSGTQNQFRKHVRAQQFIDLETPLQVHMLQNLLKYSSLKDQKSNKLCTDNSKTKCKFPHTNVLRKFFMEAYVFVSAFTKGSIAEISLVARLLL